ncbi:MAG: GNAT family N-acetyltransferase, partial [Anaerolineae bacterium]|nr:GNAT family N-acetyltransferase [Anaerolineae bacterium]
MRKELRDGLILRSLDEGYATDQERLPTFYKDVFEEADDEPNTFDVWTKELLRHPHMTLADFFVVVDPAHDEKIVSAVLLIPQTWRYEDIEIPFGRIELVATEKAYRRRGLVRELINAAHQRSESLGHIMQGITGIPHYYRQFGYAMTVDLGMKGSISLAVAPRLKDDEQPKFTLRPATVDDIPNLVAMDDYHARNASLSVVWPAETWRFYLTERSDKATSFHMLVDAEGQAVGYVGLASVEEDHTALYLRRCVVGSQSSYLTVFDDLMRALKQHAAERSDRVVNIYFDSSLSDEWLMLLRYTATSKQSENVYGWYLRLPDRAQFIQHIAPVLERRLKDSAAHRYTGEVSIGFYDFTFLQMNFEDGKLVKVENGTVQDDTKLHGEMPYHTWLHMVFGQNTYREMQQVLPDVGLHRHAA